MKLRGGEFSTGTVGTFQPELTPINDVTSQLPPKDLICDALLAQSARRVGIHWHIANWFKGR